MPPSVMTASVYVGDGHLVVEERPVPEIGPGDVLIEVAACGICGTDLHLVLEGFAKPGSVLGHEWSGTVVAAAPDVTDWAPGARVVAGPTPGCGRCRACRRGRPSVCLERDPPDYTSWRGAFARYVTASASSLLAVPEGLSTRHAALTEPTAIAQHAVHLSGVEPDDRVLITGGGPVGLLTLAVLAAEGVRDVTVSEPSALRRERARALGAVRTLSPDELGHAPMGRPVDEPFAVAFECSGRASAAESALDHLDYAGTLVLAGTGGTPPRMNQNRMIILELSVIGTYNYDAEGFAPALDLLAGGSLPLDLLVEPDDVGLQALPLALERLAKGEIAAKVLVSPHVP
ncbi:MAG TPA: alcohol dehydrogenase catalytic domain-containing protein [Acidimicrobiales bacterium]|nr:alcohol dehydrogenase catalytic domain-containing protein [Acidimicrobiales bacterium]